MHVPAGTSARLSDVPVASLVLQLVAVVVVVLVSSVLAPLGMLTDVVLLVAAADVVELGGMELLEVVAVVEQDTGSYIV